MNLQRAIERALDLTQDMKQSLDANDTVGALELLPARGEAMAAFQAAHQASSEAQRLACGAGIVQLQLADEVLQDFAALGLEAAGRALHESIKAPASTNDYEPCLSSCLDRKV